MKDDMTQGKQGAVPFLYLLPVFAIATVFLAAIFRNAWAGDDSYIVFRTIEQLFAGNGPRWNLIDRVQAYTSPLWFWLLCIPRLVSADVYLNAMAVALLLDALLVLLLYRFFGQLQAWAFALVLLVLSNSFMDYTTAGLEYPLIYLLCAVFFSEYLQYGKTSGISSLRRLSIAGGLLLVTRHDLLLTIILPLIHSARIALRAGLPGSEWIKNLLWIGLPLTGWTCFSVFYYGVPLPNTAYAKLGMDVPHLQLIEQGLAYYAGGLDKDPISILVMLAALAAGFSSREISWRIVACSVLLACAYVLWVGGDFMAGRFYAHQVLISTMLLVKFLQQDICKIAPKKYAIAAVLAMLAVYAIFFQHTPLNTKNIHENVSVEHGISDERGFYSGYTSIWIYLDQDTPYFPYVSHYRDARHFGEQGEKLQRAAAIGFAGYGAPLDIYIDDVLVLADMLRARMPRIDNEWRIGHTPRNYPVPYPNDWVIHGKLWTPDPYLNEYMQIVRVLIHDDLFSTDRFSTILKYNMGAYDELLEKSDMHKPKRSDAVNNACNHPWRDAQWLKQW